MKSQNEKQKTSETKKPRFKIEKLEERIAPHRTPFNYHYQGSGQNHGHGAGGSGGHCGHGACKYK